MAAAIFSRGARALYRHRVEAHGDGRKAPSQRGHDIVQHGAGGRGDKTDTPWQPRQRFFTCRVEQSFLRQTLLEDLERTSQRAFAGFFKILDDQLEVAAAFVKAHARPREHVQAVARFEAEQTLATAEQRAAHLRAGVLERKIHMPGGRTGKV